jgi:hypothetical protein
LLLVRLGLAVALAGAVGTTALIAIHTGHRDYLVAGVILMALGGGQALWAWGRPEL